VDRTDVAMHDHQLMYVQYLDPVTLLTCVQYLCTVKVVACMADATAAILTNVLSSLGLDIKRMAGFCSDATVCGRINGVAVQLKDMVPFMVAVHCVARRCNLVMCDEKKLVMMQKFDALYAGVHAVFFPRVHSDRVHGSCFPCHLV
jgi:hypothetical protein